MPEGRADAEKGLLPLRVGSSLATSGSGYGIPGTSFPACWLYLGTHRCTVLLAKAPPRSPPPDSSAFETPLQPIPLHQSHHPSQARTADAKASWAYGEGRHAPVTQILCCSSDPPASLLPLFLTPSPCPCYFLSLEPPPLGSWQQTSMLGSAKLPAPPHPPGMLPAPPSLCSTNAAGLCSMGAVLRQVTAAG